MNRSTIACLLSAALLMASCASERDAAPPTPGIAPDAADHASVSQPPTRPGSTGGPPPATDPPGGVLPLIPGAYVLADGDCASPPNAGVRFYDGRGISGSATHACRTTVRARRGAAHDVAQSCIDTPAGDGPRTVELQTITVHDASTFTLDTGEEAARFRRCPPQELPDHLRERIARDRDAG